MIFLVLTESDIEANILLIEKSLSSIRGVELRADLLSAEMQNRKSYQKIVDFSHAHKLQVIFTLRRVADGGEFRGSQQEAYLLYKSGLGCGFDYVDFDDGLDNEELFKLFQLGETEVIRSFHNFEAVESDRVEQLNHYSDQGYIPKAAMMVGSTSDLINLYKISKQLNGVKKIIIGMGAAGFPSRVLTQIFGSFLTFTSFGTNDKKLGHIDPITLDKLYGYYQIDRQTRLSGIIGNPVMHTRSPEIHNSAYHKQNLNALYLPFETENPALVLEWISLLIENHEIGEWGGLSVTVPYKQEVINLLDKQDPSVKWVGACNTLSFKTNNQGKQLFGMNTDVEGFLIPLKKRLKSLNQDGHLLKVAVIGAGGAARAVVAGLMQLNASIKIFNRTFSRAQQLSQQLTGKAYELSDIASFSGEFDVIVQTSSAGMGRLSAIDPSKGYHFCGQEIVYDIVYAPEVTAFLKRAMEAGCSTIGGIEMLEAQAAGQYRLFTDGNQLG